VLHGKEEDHMREAHMEQEAQVEVEAHVEQEAPEEEDGEQSTHVEQEALEEEDDGEEEEGAGQGRPVEGQLQVSWILFLFLFILYEVTNSFFQVMTHSLGSTYSDLRG
jgi:hypothetical protein